MFHIRKVIALPEVLVASTMYIVKHIESMWVDVYVTNLTASEIYHLLTKDEILGFLQLATSNLNTALVVANLTERDNLNLTANTVVWVLDATGDVSVASGSAVYIFKADTLSWIKIAETESLERVLDWTGITDKPSSTVIQIDTMVGQSHSHSNVTELDKVTEDGTAKFAYGVRPIQVEVENLLVALAGKSNSVHTHAIAEFSGVQAELDAKALISHSHTGAEFPNLRDYFVNYPTIEGPSAVYAHFANRFPITNYDAFTPYTLSASNGTVSIVNGEVIYIPAGTGAGGFTLNNNIISCTVVGYSLTPPSIISPANGLATVGKYVTFISSAFAVEPSIADTHLSSDWEIASDANFTSIVFSSYNDTNNKTAWYAEGFLTNTTYYIRVRYRGTLLISDWSPAHNFTTKSTFFGTNESAILTAYDKALNDQFSLVVTVSPDGMRIAAGARFAEVNGVVDAGKVYVFKREGLSWPLEAVLTAGEIQTTGYFGFSLCFDATGSRLVVGATGQNSSVTTMVGAVYVFSRTGTTWSQEARLFASPAGDTNSQLGRWVSITPDGTRLVTASMYEITGSMLYHGQGYIYKRTGTTWTQEATVLASDKAQDDRLGLSCSIDSTGTRIAITAYTGTAGGFVNAGKVYVWVRSGSTWTQEATLTASDKAANAYFGRSVAMNAAGDRIVVGASGATADGLTLAGKVYTFTRVGTVWTQVNILTALVPQASGNFGVGVWLSPDGNLLLAGSHLLTVNGITNAGGVYVFIRSGTTWIEQTILSVSNNLTDIRAGVIQSASDDGSIIVMSAYFADPAGVTDAGAAYVYT